jgi:hypothetical protein
MRRIFLAAMGLCLMVATGAIADPPADPGYIANPAWIARPLQAQLPANYPDADYRAQVGLMCAVHEGRLSACRAADSEPPREFLDAAIAAMTLAQIGPQDADGKSTDGRDLFVIETFPPPSAGRASSEAAALITGITWLERPNAGDFSRYWPRGNFGLSGGATLDCLVKADGHLICTVFFETPPGLGFGDAAIKIARGFRMAAEMRDGRPTLGGRVRVPITFRSQ